MQREKNIQSSRLYKLIIILTGIVAMNAVLAETDLKQPIFSLEFNIYGTGAEFRLNDIPVYTHDAQGKTISQKPIPEYIIDGENILTVKSFPLSADDGKYQPGAYIEASVSIRENNSALSSGKVILQLKLNPTSPEDKLLDGSIAEAGKTLPSIIEHSDTTTIAERRIQTKSPFPRWAWQDGQAIGNDQGNHDGLLLKYKEIWEALDSGDLDKLRKLYDPAAREFASAYHYEDNQQGHRIMNTGGYINDKDWVLGNINTILHKVKFHLYIYANGKLAHLVDEDNEQPLITYLNRSARMINTQKFSFYKNKSGEWIMIR